MGPGAAWLTSCLRKPEASRKQGSSRTFQQNFLWPWKCSMLSNMAAPSHMCLLSSEIWLV